MQNLPKHAAFLQDIHDFLKSLAEESMPELVPERVLYEIYLEKMGIAHDRSHQEYYMTERFFGQSIAHVLKNEDPGVLPYKYVSSCQCGLKNGHSRFIGLSALCQKYNIAGWDGGGATNFYYSGSIWDKEKAGYPYGKAQP